MTAPQPATPGSDSVREEIAASRRAAVIKRLRGALDELDAKTRLPGEPSLRSQVAEQARERLAEIRTTNPSREETHRGE